MMKLNDVWTVVESRTGDKVVMPIKPLLCPVCGGELILHDFRAYHHPQMKMSHVDIHLKCKSCGLWLTFGVPAPHDVIPELRRSRYHGITLRWELTQIYKELDDKIVERLRRWGYW